MTSRPIELAALVIWLAYAVVLTIVLAAQSWELGSFVLFWPPALLLGVLVPRWPVVLAPLVLSIGLGFLAFDVACPCYENTTGFFAAWWIGGFGLPSTALAAAGVAVRRSLGSAGPAA